MVIETLSPFTTTNNNRVNCVVCNGGKIHKMGQKYMVCSSKLIVKIVLQNIVLQNMKLSIVWIKKFFKLNEHIYDHDIDLVAEKRIGLLKELKNVIEDSIVTKDIHTSKKKLQYQTKSN